MRDTSLEAYQAILHGGLLKKMQFRVYEALFKNGPLTRSELDNLLKEPDEVNPSYHKRLSELERLGVVARVDKRRCLVTARIVYGWDVTAQLPSEPERHEHEEHQQPAPKELEAALNDFRRACQVAAEQGYSPSSEFIKTLRWLLSGALCAKCGK